MRSEHWLLGTFAVVACSLDHVVVAGLDDARNANPGGVGGVGGVSASAGSPNLSAGAGAGAGGVVINVSGAPSQSGGDRFILLPGGTSGDVQIEADAGAGNQLLCSCNEQLAEACGRDGITYQQPFPCDDAGACIQPDIACFHACPCLAGEPMGGAATPWFWEDCAATAQCAEGFTCLTVDGAAGVGLSGCDAAGN